MITGWRRLTREQLDHLREHRMNYDSQALVNWRWQAIARADNRIQCPNQFVPEPCHDCRQISRELGYRYMLDIWRDFAGWAAMDEDIRILYHYTGK